MRRTFLPLLLVVAMAGLTNADQTATGPGGIIDDAGTNPIVSTATIAASETITDVEITIFGLTHTWSGDLIITLTSPDLGTVLSIVNGIDSPDNSGFGSSSDFAGDYTFSNDGGDIWAAAAGDPIPAGDYFASAIDGSFLSFDVFNGEDAAGDWTLSIEDRSGGDMGSFSGWEVRVGGDSAIPEPTSLMVIALAGLAGFVRRRRA